MGQDDLKLLSLVRQEGFPLTSRPFPVLETLGLTEDEVMRRLCELQRDGLIRRIGPILDLRKLGMSGIFRALQVPIEEADEAAKVVNRSQKGVTLCGPMRMVTIFRPRLGP